MNPLRVLLVESDPAQSERIADRLEKASHAVLPTGGLDEAAQALEMQKFDAVMMTARFVNSQLRSFRESLNHFESGKPTGRIPVVCYSSPILGSPTVAELSQYKVDACLPEDFEAAAFSALVANLAHGLSLVSARAGNTPALPTFNREDFCEQVGFDQELIVEIVELFLADSQTQLDSMRKALHDGDLLRLSREAHSIKGSLGSLYATQAAARAHAIEQLGKTTDRESCSDALTQLETALAELKPELLALRDAQLGS